MRTRSILLALLVCGGCATAPSSGPRPIVRSSELSFDPGLASARCERGFAADCRALGRARLLGSGVARDDRLGAALATKACELGDPAGCGDLGVLYALGRALPQSDVRADALSRRACESGAALACSNLGALIAAGAAGEPEAGSAHAGEPAPLRALRLFRMACEAGVPEGCLNLGTALEEGRLDTGALSGAVRAYRRACDAGLGLACHRLALLIGERTEAAAGLSSVALEARACGAAIEPACLAVNGPTPLPGPRTPGSRLLAERTSFALGIPGAGGFHPGELAPVAGGRKRTLEEARRPPAALQASVAPALRGPLGIDGDARPDEPADPAVELLVELRRGLLGQCAAVPRAAAGGVEALAVFLVDGDGRVAMPRVATLPADAALDACILEQVSSWEFPAAADGLGGPYLVRHRFEPSPAPAALAGPGWLRPALRDPHCVERTLEVPEGYGGGSAAATVRLAVDGAGVASQVHPLAPLPEQVLAAVAEAVRRCAWRPGADPDGRIVPEWTTLTVSLGR